MHSRDNANLVTQAVSSAEDKGDSMRSSLAGDNLGGTGRGPTRATLLFVAAALIGINPTTAKAFITAVDSVDVVSRWVSESAVIVRGAVASSRAFERDGQRGAIFTEVNFRVTDIIKGTLPDSILTFEFEGGTVGTLTKIVIHGTGFLTEPGEEAIVFLKADSGESLSPRGLSLELLPEVWGGVIALFRGKVIGGRQALPADTYAQYLRVLSKGRKVSLDAFLQSLPKPKPAFTPAAVGPGGTPHFDSPPGVETAPEPDSTAAATDSLGSPQRGADSASKLVPGPDQGVHPAAHRAPPHMISEAVRSNTQGS